MSQTSVSTSLTAAFAGMSADLSGVQETISRVISTQQLDQVSIDGADDGTFTVSIDGTVEATYAATSAAASTIAAGLLASASSPTANVEFTAGGTAITMLIESLLDSLAGSDTSFTTGVASDGTSSDITVSTLVAQDQEVPFGIFVCADERAAVSGTQCRLPRQAADITGALGLGIAQADTTRESNSGAWPNQSAVAIKRFGRIYVRVEDAVSEGGDVYVRYTDPSTNYGLGSFRSDADSDAAKLPGASYRTSASAGGFAIVELIPYNT